MRGNRDLRVVLQAVLAEVGNVLAQLTIGQGGHGGLVVDNPQPRVVKQDGARLNLDEQFLVNHPGRFLAFRHVDGDEVGPLDRVSQGGGPLHPGGQVPCGVHRQVGVVANHVHPQVNGGVSDQGTDVAHPDHGQALAEEFVAVEARLFAFGAQGDVFANVLGAPVGRFDQVPVGDDHQGDDHFLHRVGVTARGVENGDPLFGAGVERNVVKAGPAAGDR